MRAPPVPARPAAADREARTGRKADALLAALSGPTVAPPIPVAASLYPAVPLVAALGARAVTLGPHIAFAPGHYRPDTATGRALLAHEATHVAQQAAGGTATRNSAEAAADRAAAGHTPPALGAPLAPAFSLLDYQQSRGDLEEFIAALSVSELRSDIAEINEYLDRQTTSNDDTAHLNEAKARLEARLVRLIQKANAPAPAKPKAAKGAKAKKAPANKEKDDAPVGPLAIPRILSEGTSRQLTDPDEINREVDVIVAWLQQKDVPKAERQILQAELQALSPDFEAIQAQKSQGRQTARLAAAFANPTEDAAGLKAQLAIVEGIGTDPAEPGMAFIYHEGERLRITAQQAADIRAKSVAALKAAVAGARAKAVDAENLYAAHSQVNSEHPIVSRIAGFLGGVDDPVMAMASAKAFMQVTANSADQLLAQGQLAAAAEPVVAASSHARRMYMAAYAWQQGQIAGAETAVAGLTFVRDASFAIAIAIGAVVAAPVVAGGVAALGVTGGGATLLTIAGTAGTVGTGAAVVGGGAEYGGQRLAGADHGTAMKSAKEEGWRRFKEGAAAGAGGATTKVISTGLGQASTRGGQLGYDILAQGGGSAVGGMTGAALEGKSADEILLEGGRQGLLGTVAPVAGAPFSKPGTKLLVGAAASSGANFLDAKARGASNEEAFRGVAIGLATTGVLHAAPQPKPGGKPGAGKPGGKPPPDAPEPRTAAPDADTPKLPAPDVAEQTMAGTAKPGPAKPATPDSDPFPARIAPGQPDHDAWVNATIEKGLKTRPPPLPKPNAPPPKVGETRYGLKSMDEAIRVYDDFRARAKGREVGIYRDSETGHYAVVAGKEGSVSAPRAETRGNWDNVVHNHPNPTNALTYRNPAPQDILGPGPSGFALEAMRSRRPVTTFIDSDIPGGGRRFTAVTTHPDGKIEIRYQGADGKPVSKSYGSIDDFQKDWSSRKLFVDAPDPKTAPPPGQGNTPYDDLIRDTNEWLRVRRQETGDPFEPGQTMAGTAKPGASTPGTVAPGASTQTPATTPPKPENDFSDVGAAVGTNKPGTVAAQGPSRNRFPDFAPVTPAEAPKVAQQVTALSKALGEPMPVDRALAAPWVGRPRNKAGETMSSGTSEGWLRSDYRYWKAFAQAFPADYALIGPGRTVTPGLAARWGWSAKTIGQKLTHHHIDNGSIVLPVPEGLHQGQSGDIHATPRVEGRP